MNHHELLFANIERYRKDQQFCDITFDVMGTKFPLHRLVISSASNYFETMFTKGLVKPDQKEVVMKGVTPSAFKNCSDYIYKFTMEIQVDKLCETFHAACLFQIMKLMEKCVEQIRAIIDFDNCIEFYQFSLKEECQEIEEESRDVMLKNAEKILTDDFIISTMEEESLLMMLKSDELNISDESVAFQALVKWTDMDKDRMDEFCDLLQHVRLPVTNGEFFTSVVYENEHIQKKCAECKRYLQRTVMQFVDGKDHGLKPYQLMKRTRLATSDGAQVEQADELDSVALDNSDFDECENIQSESENEDITDASAVEDNSGNTVNQREREIVMVDWECKSFKLFDFEEGLFGEYLKIDPTPIPTTCLALIHHNNRIYAMGGNKRRRSFYCDYRHNKIWQEIMPLPNKHNYTNNYRYASSVVCFRDKILVIGAREHDIGLNFVSGFCTKTNRWAVFPALNVERFDIASVATNKAVYAIGGHDGYDYLATVEVFKSKNWKIAPTLNVARSNASAVHHNGKIFVAGGRSRTDCKILTSVETFVEGDSSWTNIASLNIGRSCASMFTHHEKLYVFGGERQKSNLSKSNLYEVWCEASNTWKLSEVRYNTIAACKILLCSK